MIGHMWWGDGGFGWGILGAFFSFLFWLVIILVLVGIFRGRGHGLVAGRGGGSALRVLEERYARGEIDREEFVERRRVLTGESGETPPRQDGGSTPPSSPPGGEPTAPLA